MADELTQLERLTRLWREGGLTDEEFAARKAALAEAPPTPPLPWPLLVSLAALALVLLTALVVWFGHGLGRPAPLSVADSAAPGAASAAASAAPALPTGPIAAPTTQAAFAVAYPTGKGEVSGANGAVHVAFAPFAVYRIGDNTFALVSKGRNLDDDSHVASGFFSIAYLAAAPQLALQGQPFVAAGSQGGFGAPPGLKLLSKLAASPVLQITSGGTGQGVVAEQADLVALGPTAGEVVVVAQGLPLSYDDGGTGAPQTCAITGKIVPGAVGKTFTIAYSGSWTGKTLYRWTGARWEPQGGAPDLSAKCPKPDAGGDSGASQEPGQ